MTRLAHRSIALSAVALLLTACPDTSSPSDAGGNDVDGAPGVCPQPCHVSVLAGEPGGGGALDGVGTAARFATPSLVVGSGASLYVSDAYNGVIRRVDTATGKVETFAGTLGVQSFAAKDGVGTAATFGAPGAMALLDGALYVSDFQLYRTLLRRIDLTTRAVTTVLESGKPWSQDIFALASGGGKLFVGAYTAVWRHDPKTKAFELVAGKPGEEAHQDGVGTAARFDRIGGLALDSNVLYIAGRCVLRRLELSTGQVSTIVGQYDACFAQDGVGAAARLNRPRGLALQGKTLYLVEDNLVTYAQDAPGEMLSAPFFGQIRAVNTETLEVKTLAGQIPSVLSRAGEADGPGLQARLFYPQGAWAAGDGTVYFVTQYALRALKSGQVSTVAGHLATPLLQPGGAALNDQHLWVFLKGREQLVRIHTSSGEVEVMNTWSKEVALEDCRGLARIGARLYCAETFELRSYDMGTGAFTEVYPPDVSTVLRDVTTDGQQLYLSMLHQTSSSVKQRIVRVDPKTGKASTLLDTDALSGAVRMVWVDKALYITTRERLVRFDLASKKLTTVAGVAGKPGCKDGVGAQARLRYPAGIASDGAGGLYIGDRDCHTLSHLDLASGKLVTVAGSPKNATFCPGQGAAAGINNPSQLVYEQKSGTLLVVDGYEGLVLRVTRRPPSGDAGVGALEAGSLDAAPAQ